MPVRCETKGRLARITLDRPPLNVLGLEELAELGAAVERAAGASVVVLTGAGAHFSAGNAVQDHTRERAPAMLERFHAAVRGLRALSGVTVADVRGAALGGGCELVAACDLAVAHPEAEFGQPEIDVGCFPPVAAVLLPRRIGPARAARLLLTGERIDAATAEAWGLVSHRAEGGAGAVVDTLLGKSDAVLRVTKQALRAASLDDAERLYREELLPLEDCTEGVRAFLEKRAPRWGHRGRAREHGD